MRPSNNTSSAAAFAAPHGAVPGERTVAMNLVPEVGFNHVVLRRLGCSSPRQGYKINDDEVEKAADSAWGQAFGWVVGPRYG